MTSNTPSVRVRYEELWAPWDVDEPPAYEGQRSETWAIPDDLVARFKAAKSEMETVWRELRQFDPRYEE